MEPQRTGTGAAVRHANTYSDVGDHVAFGVDPPCDRQFFFFPVDRRLLGYRTAAKVLEATRRGCWCNGRGGIEPQHLSRSSSGQAEPRHEVTGSLLVVELTLIVLLPGTLSLIYHIPGHVQASSEASGPPGRSQDLQPSCPVDEKPPPPV
ncbi:hypothetical protein FQA47_023993 [Oryzias melastigma]|uniref:Uncharacterized protein n=1 Tax=Oryzias melastigma TaxID=30732 RepID=A0A834FTN8_ORYME|nr:hypothetical protein FQA47_023993 [Oryzias melastigma]